MPSAGATASGGFTYQHRVAAYFAACSLAGSGAPALPGFEGSAFVEAVWLETTDAVDDIKLVVNRQREIHIQAKRTLTAGRGAKSELGKACSQLVAAICDVRTPATTQFVIAAGPGSSDSIRTRLRLVLENVHDQPETSEPAHIAPSEDTRRVYDAVTRHLRRNLAAAGKAADDRAARQILKRTHLLILDVEPGGPDQRNADMMLRGQVIANAADATNGWNALLTMCAELARRQSHTDRHGFQKTLMNAGIGLKTPLDMQGDIERLRAVTASARSLFTSRAAIPLPGDQIKIARGAVPALMATLSTSLVIVGEAGIGKTGVLSCVLDDGRFGSADRVVVALAAEELEAHSARQLATELGLSRPMHEILADWPTDAGLLVIDGIDAAKDDATRQTLIELVEKTAQDESGFRVLASMRTFDARNSVRLRRAFATPLAVAAPGYNLRDLAGIAHFAVPALTVDELAQVSAQAPAVERLLRDAPPGLWRLAAVPFNLRLLVELLTATGLSAEELQQFDTQSRLLEAYWGERVLTPAVQSDDREFVLRKATERMAADRRLYVARSFLQAERNESLQGLLHDGVLVERVLPGGTVDRDVVGFAHNVLFDYAVARLLLRGDEGALLRRIESDPQFLISVWLSFDLHFRWLWELERSREPFWRVAVGLAASERVRPIAKTIAPRLALDLCVSETDLAGLVCRLDAAPGDASRAAAEAFMVQLTGALLAETPPGLAAPDRPWVWLAEELSSRLRPALAFAVRAITQHLLDA